MAAKRKKTRAAKPITLAKKKKFMTQLEAAEAGLKTLAASVKALRSFAAGENYAMARPTAGKRRRRRG